MSHLFKVRHRKKFLENFWKIISQERHIKTFFQAPIVSIFTYSFNDNSLPYQNEISMKIVIMNFREKLRKSSLLFISKNKILKDFF